MAAMNVFKTTTSGESPLDASRGTEEKPTVSDFLTVQSFANFALMTGAIAAAWHALQKIMPSATTLWVPYGFAFVWAIISVLISLEGLKKGTDGSGKLDLGTVLGAIFVAAINSLVLAGAVVGTNIATGQNP
jgi:hypothetical protein